GATRRVASAGGADGPANIGAVGAAVLAASAATLDGGGGAAVGFHRSTRARGGSSTLRGGGGGGRTGCWTTIEGATELGGGGDGFHRSGCKIAPSATRPTMAAACPRHRLQARSSLPPLPPPP